MTYCACDYPLRETGRDVLTGDTLMACDQCGASWAAGPERHPEPKEMLLREGATGNPLPAGRDAHGPPARDLGLDL